MKDNNFGRRNIHCYLSMKYEIEDIRRAIIAYVLNGRDRQMKNNTRKIQASIFQQGFKMYASRDCDTLNEEYLKEIIELGLCQNTRDLARNRYFLFKFPRVARTNW